ncbi:hypothetical protein AX15_000124 [Amanita polypyramis BW_CC]|nr:hypothetical protein AX15_000124 [Amanita polypyramis BW_CC]
MQEALGMRLLERRHTKPCKFYQTMSCPLPADVCDFAHVLVNPNSAPKIDNACRYYQTGFHTEGPWYRSALSIEASSAPANGMRIFSSVGWRMGPSGTGWLRPFVPQISAGQRFPVHGPTATICSSSSVPPLPVIPTKAPIAPYTPRPLMKPRSSPNTTLPSPSIPPDGVRNLQMGGHSHSSRSRIYNTNISPPVHVPSYSTSSPHTHLSVSPLDHHYQIPASLYVLEQTLVPVQQPLKKRRSKGISRKKVERYKTKPCRYFTVNGTCPNEGISSIHDENPEILRENYLTDLDGIDGRVSESSGFSSQLFSADDQAAEQNAVYVSVMALSIEDRTPSTDAARGGGQNDSTVPSNPHVCLGPASVPERGRGSAANGVETRGRPRASSIPSMPSVSNQMNNENLFAAESPAILNQTRERKVGPRGLVIATIKMSMLDKFRRGAQKAGIQATAFVQQSSIRVASGSRDFVQTFTLPGEAEKAANILGSFLADPDDPASALNSIPKAVLQHARGLAIFQVIKAGFVFSGKAGSGIVIARLPDGSWSAPSCIATGGLGWGLQVGADITDFVIVLNSEDAVRAFSIGGNVTIGGNISAAAGPIGTGGSVQASLAHPTPMFSYSKSKGLFAGLSLEGTVLIERKDANRDFYGSPVPAKDILSGRVPPPEVASRLYEIIEAAEGLDETSLPGQSYVPTSAPVGRQNQTVFDADNPKGY